MDTKTLPFDDRYEFFFPVLIQGAKIFRVEVFGGALFLFLDGG